MASFTASIPNNGLITMFGSIIIGPPHIISAMIWVIYNNREIMIISILFNSSLKTLFKIKTKRRKNGINKTEWVIVLCLMGKNKSMSGNRDKGARINDFLKSFVILNNR